MKKQLVTIFFLLLAISAGAMNRDSLPMQFDTIRVDTFVDLSTRVPREMIVRVLRPYVALPGGEKLYMRYEERRREVLARKD